MIHTGTAARGPARPAGATTGPGAAPAAAGYSQPWVVAPGQNVALHASMVGATTVDIVRIGCANAERAPDGALHGPAERIVDVAGTPRWTLPAAPQPLVPGVQVIAELAQALPLAETMLVFAVQRSARGAAGPVLAALDAQGQGLRIDIEGDADPRRATVCIRSAGPGVSSEVHRVDLPGADWLLLTLQLGGSGATTRLQLRTAVVRAHFPEGVPAAWTETAVAWSDGPVGALSRWHIGTLNALQPSADVRLDLLSALPAAVGARLEPRDIAGVADVADVDGALAGWERALVAAPGGACLLRGRSGCDSALHDLCGGATVAEVQRPYTAVRGLRWDGRAQGPAQAPTHYTAFHLNSDTLLDAHWAPSLSWPVPADLPSGCYAFRLSRNDGQGGEASYASFFVSAANRPQHRLAVLLPTFTYLAYSNATEEMRGPPITDAPHVAEARLDAVHPAFGRSIYERHPDGQGVLYCSSRRPMLSVSPGHRPWGLVADSWLLDWLERSGQAFDIITDHDLHERGEAALAPFAAVITGHHPEYWSTPMWDGLWRYLNEGGRLLYLGGNGLYWRTAYHAAAEAIEVRRAEDGTRPSIAPPGEFHCAFSGEYGGLWRRLGRPPQQIVGVGMAAQGFEHAAHYRRCDDAAAPEVGFVFDGVAGDSFGHGGALGGGASGWEIDRTDADLGTPAGTWWLARSEGHAASTLRTKEELLSYVPPFRDAKARSDVALAPVGAGDVFAVGSMTWFGSLHGASPAEVTDVAKITANVIRRFLDPAPIPRKPTSRHAPA